MGSFRKSCFEDEEEDIVEVGISGNIMYRNHYNHPSINRFCSGYSQRRRTAVRDLVPSSPRSYFDARLLEDHEPHFLDSCFLCKKRLGDNRDIFMYRGDLPFCSEDCRQEQIDADEAKEKKKNWNLSASMKVLRKKDANRSSSPSKVQNYPFRSGTVVAG